MTIDVGRLEAVLNLRSPVLEACANIETICRLVAEGCEAAIPSGSGAIISLLDGDRLICRVASGTAAACAGRTIPRRRSLAGRSIDAAEAVLCADVEQDYGIDRQAYLEMGIRSAVTVPVHAQGIIAGAITVFSERASTFEANDVLIARLLAGELTIGLSSAAEERADETCRSAQARFQAITEALPQMIWSMTPEGGLTYANRRIWEFLGTKAVTSLRREALAFVDPRDRSMAARAWESGLAGAEFQSIECRLLSSDGASRWFLLNLVPVPNDRGKVHEWIGAGIDIDDRKAMEINLQDAVRGRDLLLYEVNHRVKNSLQLATGLLAIQASKVREPEAYQRLLDARNQIATIAQVHQAIYKAGAHDRVEFAGFLRDLAEALIGKSAGRTASFRLTGVQELILSLDRAVPVALIAGELITNALKHVPADSGSPPARNVEIEIEVERAGTQVILNVVDNGPGLPAGFDPTASKGLGMEIVFGLAEQVGGRIELASSKSGAHLRLTFPAE